MSSNPFMPLVGFRSEKAAQVSAYFLKAYNGKMDKLALIKLVYIAERDSVKLRSRPMIYDECYSLKDGPVCKSALDGINGHIDEVIWSKYLHVDGSRDVYLVSGAVTDLDQLSKSDMSILDGVLSVHKGKSGSQLRSWTHNPDNVPEYTPVFGKDRIPINYTQMAKAVGISHPEDISEVEALHRLSDHIIPRIRN